MADHARHGEGAGRDAAPASGPDTIELRAFMGLAELFRTRGWPVPLPVRVHPGTTGPELLRQLDIAPEQVEVVFVNGKAVSPDLAVVSGGDRVALAPPGVPGPYRVLLGFRKM
ncbi:MoaD/ThiS family protein [Nitratidesulfovibrio liaohensis]|uniref:MoaD/ThiS family protein n=1 Tax=Nitratidesulfovibrio liaohensis TaxID=2604158 RepID=UPI001AAE45B5|nr:MoaD/ThiS family protein [Nitratidesulfovibrio liaohensis]